MGGMLFLIFGAIGFGFFLIFLLALSDKKRKAAREGGPGEPRPYVSFLQFQKACAQVVEAMKLEIEEVNQIGDARLDMIARNPTPFTGGQFLVHCLYLAPHETITAVQVIELSNMVLQERLSKGIFITTGRFTHEIPTIGELAPIEYIDGAALKGLVEKYKIVHA